MSGVFFAGLLCYSNSMDLLSSFDLRSTLFLRWWVTTFCSLASLKLFLIFSTAVMFLFLMVGELSGDS